MRSPCCSDWPSWISKPLSSPVTGARMLSWPRLLWAMPMLLLSEPAAARSCASWLDCSASVCCDAAPQDLEPLGLVGEVVAGVVERLHRDKAAVGERLVQIILAPRLGEVGLGLVEVAQVGIARLGQRELLAAHVVELLLDLGLLLERRQLQLGVRKHGQQLACGHLRAILDQLLARRARLRPHRDRP